MSYLAPFTGFGDDQHSSIKFGILMGSDGRLPIPTVSRRVARLPMASGNRVVKQRRGFTEWVWTWTLEFESIDDYERMVNLQGESATLRFLAGLTPTMGGVVDPILDTMYLHLPATFLANLEAIEITPEGIVEATATFERPYVAPVTPDVVPWPPPPNPFPLSPTPLIFAPFSGSTDAWDSAGDPVVVTTSGPLRYEEVTS